MYFVLFIVIIFGILHVFKSVGEVIARAHYIDEIDDLTSALAIERRRSAALIERLRDKSKGRRVTIEPEGVNHGEPYNRN